jgi:hypothetical protein
MRTSEEIREERRKYENDVAYEVWRHGGNMDNVNSERIEEHYYEGAEVDHAAHAELQAQRQRHEPEEQFPEEQFEDAPQE